MKLYLVVRSDLPSGAKMAQLAHAMRQWSHEHPQRDKAWFETSNTLVCLQAGDVDGLAEGIEARGHAVARFHEPDFGGILTAIAVEGSACKLLSQLPLAR